MELLIASGVALMGYKMSAAAGPADDRPLRPTKPFARPMGPGNEYLGPGNDTRGLTRDYIAAAEQRWQDARDPALTGVVTPNTKLTNAMLPFFTSAKKQNTNDAVKQTRLETFTGATSMDSSMTGTWRKKREVETLFKPDIARQPVTSSGSAGNGMYEREDDRFVSGVVHNNVLPAPKVYVGRGVGVGPDVAATDGFHPMHRVMLKNVGEYKKNNLPGRALGGAVAGGVANRPSEVTMGVNRAGTGALVMDQERRPMQASLAAVLAPRLDSELPKDTSTKPKPLEMDRWGNPTRAGHEARDTREDRVNYSGRDNFDRNHTLPRLNLTGAAAGVGGFTNADFDGCRFASQQREWGGREGFLTGPKGRELPQGQILPPTQRDMTSVGYVGGVGRIASSGEVRKGTKMRATLRDTQGANDAITGTKGAVLGGTLDNVWRYNRLGRQAARRGDQLAAHTPAMSGAMNLRSSEAIGKMALRSDQVQAKSPYLPAVPNKGYSEQVGTRTTPHNKLPHANPRLDLCTATEQLKCNPYARSLWGAQ